MLDVTQSLKTTLFEMLTTTYQSHFGEQHADHLKLILSNAELTVDSIARSNASYHNVEHTIYVTSAGQSILEGKGIDSDVSADEWLNATIALLFHDIGFAPKLCKRDDSGKFYAGKGDEIVEFERGKTDASLMPYHVDRGQCFVGEQFADNDLMDVPLIQQCIERTRFPIPDTPEYDCIDDLPGLVRAADLIGQFSDPRYLNKLNALFQEFDEQGLNQKIGYHTLADMYENYPEFYEGTVLPYIKEGLRLLQLTERGKDILASMERNIDTVRRHLAK